MVALILPAQPPMLSPLGTEDRLSAAFDLRCLRSLEAQAGWRVPALTLAVAIFALPFTAMHGLIVTSTDWAPWIEDLSADDLANLLGSIAVGLAVLAFVTAWIT